MKVSVTVDESIYPELHELMESMPVSKRARVLANLAFKACLLSNAALMNTELTTPSKGRRSGRKKTIHGDAIIKKQNVSDHKKTGAPVGEENTSGSGNIIPEPDVTAGKIEGTLSGVINDVSHQTDHARENIFSVSAGASENNPVQVGSEEGNSAGEGKNEVDAPQPVIQRKRRILG